VGERLGLVAEMRPSLGPLIENDVVPEGDPGGLRTLPPNGDIQEVCWPDADGDAPFHTALAYLDGVVALEVAHRAARQASKPLKSRGRGPERHH
jgi:hypothetical protein